MKRLRSASGLVPAFASLWRGRLAALTMAVVLWESSTLSAIRGGALAVFGPVGITRGQMLRVNVSGIGNPNDMPWTFHARVLDAAGDVVLERRFELRPGVSGFVDVRFGEGQDLPPNARRVLRAEIVGFNPQPDPPGDWVTTLEVIDLQTGRTTVLLGGPDTVEPQTSR
jgi:hypothetical protein